MDFIEVSPLPEICKTVGIDFFALKTEKVNGAAMNATTWGNALCVCHFPFTSHRKRSFITA